MSTPWANNPLHSITLKMIVEQLVALLYEIHFTSSA